MIVDRDPGDENDAPRALPMRDAFPRASDALEVKVAWAMDFLDGQPTPLMRNRFGALLDHQRQHHQGR